MTSTTLKIRILALALCCIFISSCQREASNAAPQYRDASGHSGNFSDHRGKWMIINYWATWCKPCLEEIPELNHFATVNAERAVLFAVDFDNAKDEKLESSIKKMGIEFPVLIDDPHALLGFEKPYALPTTFVFNPEGVLHRTLLGPQTEKSLLSAISGPSK